MGDALVTIVTMTYRDFSGLRDTINSVLSQTYRNIEYIISDDGSGDFPRSDIESMLSKGNISRYIIRQNNPNVGTVRNANGACREATGKYIMFLSCGDVFYEPDTVEKVAARFEREGCDLLAVRRVAFTGDHEPLFFMPHNGAIKKLGKLKTASEQYNAYITTHYWDAVSGSALYYKKSTLESYGYFDDRYVLWEDGPFIERYLRSNPITYAFDIIGIWYELGGVSTGAAPNPLLLKDQTLFDQTDRLIRIDEVSFFSRRCIRYINKRSYCKRKADVIKTMLKYPDAAFSNLIYQVMNRIYTSQDKTVLKRERCNINKG